MSNYHKNCDAKSEIFNTWISKTKLTKSWFRLKETVEKIIQVKLKSVSCPLTLCCELHKVKFEKIFSWYFKPLSDSAKKSLTLLKMSMILTCLHCFALLYLSKWKYQPTFMSNLHLLVNRWLVIKLKEFIKKSLKTLCQCIGYVELINNITYYL